MALIWTPGRLGCCKSPENWRLRAMRAWRGSEMRARWLGMCSREIEREERSKCEDDRMAREPAASLSPSELLVHGIVVESEILKPLNP